MIPVSRPTRCPRGGVFRHQVATGGHVRYPDPTREREAIVCGGVDVATGLEGRQRVGFVAEHEAGLCERGLAVAGRLVKVGLALHGEGCGRQPRCVRAGRVV